MQIPRGIPFLDCSIQRMCHHVLCFLLGKFNIQRSQLGNRRKESVEIHFYVSVNLDTEVLLNDGIQQIHTAEHICRVNSVCPVTGNRNIHVTHQRRQINLVRLCVDAADNHRVGTGASVFPFPAVLSDNQNILDIIIREDVRIYPCQIYVVPAFRRCVYRLQAGNVRRIFRPVHMIHLSQKVRHIEHGNAAYGCQKNYNNCNNFLDHSFFLMKN